MIRYTLLSLFITFIAVYAWKDWYKSLCALIVLMAVMERPDMPKQLMGIPGANPWNFLFAVIALAWFSSKKKEKLYWDLPKSFNWLGIFYLIIVLIGFYRLVSDLSGMQEFFESRGSRNIPSVKGQLIDRVLNTVKYTLPGLLLFHGCTSKQRLNWAVSALSIYYFILAILIIRSIGLGGLSSGSELSAKAIRRLDRDIGYFRTDLAMLMAGGFWVFIALEEYFKLRWQKLLMFAIAGACFLALMLTGGRMGQIAWAAVGCIMCYVRWRRYLVLAPVVVIIGFIAVPSAFERLMEGVNTPSGEQSEKAAKHHARGQKKMEQVGLEVDSEHDLYAITSGRVVAWPLIVQKIQERPLIGFGRQGMANSGLSLQMSQAMGEAFPHPHNAYLEFILDNGLLGAIPIFILYWMLVKRSFSLFKDSRSPYFTLIGAMCFAVLMAQLFASMGAQSFYPVISSTPLWCVMGLMMRVYLDRELVFPPKRGKKPKSKRLADFLWVKDELVHPKKKRGGLSKSFSPSPTNPEDG